MRSKYLSALAAVCFSSLTSLSASAFTWGANGHEMWGGPVWGNPEQQFATMQKYGLTSYRFELPLVDDHPEAAANLKNLITLAAKYNIKLHPVIYLPFHWNDNATDAGKYPATEAGLEQQGYNRAYPMVKQFASQIQDWEMENEISLMPGIKNGPGYLPAHYETTKGHQWAAAIRGMSRAIKDVQQQSGQKLNTIVDIMYVDFGFIGFLQNNGVTVDKIGYHYYYTLNQTPYQIWAPDGKQFDILAELKKTGKPILINEFNAAEIYAPVNNPPSAYNDTQALLSLQKHINFLRTQTEAPIESVEYYELYNDTNPQLNAAESNFGLMQNATYAKTQLLLAAAYSCGTLSTTEQSTLMFHGVFSSASLASQLATCPPANTAGTPVATPTPTPVPVTTTPVVSTGTPPAAPIDQPIQTQQPRWHHRHHYHVYTPAEGA